MRSIRNTVTKARSFLMRKEAEAEAVSPHITLTEIASEIIGLLDIFIMVFCIVRKIGKDLIILPYPTIALELSSGKKEFLTPMFNISFKLGSFLKFKAKINIMAITMDIITLQVPETLSSETPYLTK